MSFFPNKNLTVGGDDPFLPTLLQAINHADHISITVAFVRQSGLALLFDALNEALSRRVKVRILTGDYLNITDPVALRSLLLLAERGAEVKIFQSDGQSFHMKAYIFVGAATNDGCAFIGSSNISKSALEHGLEWNVLVHQRENTLRFSEILSEFERVYHDARCAVLSHDWIAQYVERQKTVPISILPELDVNDVEAPPKPNRFQLEALEALNSTRENGFYRGLVVMATGLGKTWLAAFDTQQLDAKKILFVAHREEILDQAEETFVCIHSDRSVGRYDARSKDTNVEILFASIQTLGQGGHLGLFDPKHFDYVIVDEFHHASARTYQKLLSHFTPKFLLGLTATPDRTDQSDICALCDDNLVFSKGLYEGIDSGVLCPFEYLGIADTVDYKEISWRNGKFDPKELSSQFATESRANHNFKYWSDNHQSRTLAFCISHKHADYMAEYFRRKNVRALSVHSKSETPRNEALRLLRDGKIQVVFSVDLFNEGTDLPSIDTVLMLRPTESKIVFLQQLGRGLRVSRETNKRKLVILDYIGNHLSFFRKSEALWGVGVTNNDRREFIEDLKKGTLKLPRGCFVNYDLESITFMEGLLCSRSDRQVEIYEGLKESYGRRPTLSEFHRANGLVKTVVNDCGGWFQFVGQQGDLDYNEKLCFERFSDFFSALEGDSPEGPSRFVLVEALIELNYFAGSATMKALAERGFMVFRRRRTLQGDLPDVFQGKTELSDDQVRSWCEYWVNNPVKAWIKNKYQSRNPFFSYDGGNFCFNRSIPNELSDIFPMLVQEIINFRFLQFESRKNNANYGPVNQFDFQLNSESQEIPYFSDLKIACGHFRGSGHSLEEVETKPLPLTFGKLDSKKCFLARAVGNSMNGGKNPIKSGDYLLLERISPNNAGSNDGRIVAIERQDVLGDDQYLLRLVRKRGEGKYELRANNPEYEPIFATEEMSTFARLKSIVYPSDIFLYQSFMRENIPELFGLEFNTGLWRSGHVRPKDHADQFLLVTLVKQGRIEDHQYRDYFVSNDEFHWQSQNNTDANGAVGQRVVNHLSNNSKVHLFVRKHRLDIHNRAAPFFYCGTLSYVSHSSSKPMNVKWLLDNPLPDDLLTYFES